MIDVFVLRNQHNEYLNKSREWIASGDSKTLYRTEHRDEVINEKVEIAVKRPDLRIQSINATQATNGKIFIDEQDCLPKAQAPELPDEDTISAQSDLLDQQDNVEPSKLCS